MPKILGGISTDGVVEGALGFRHGPAPSPTWTTGLGDPEGVVTAPVGSLYSRKDGDTDTAIYRKEVGTGNTGWIAVAATPGPEGPPGPAGISQGQYEYKWKTTTNAADPDVGYIKGDNANTAAITNIYASVYNNQSQAVVALFKLEVGHEIDLYEFAKFDTWNRYTLTGLPINHANTWVELPVAFVETGPLPFAPPNNTRVNLVVPITGEPGPPGPAGPAGPGVPVGGSAGQVLGKASGADYDTQWRDSSGAVSSVDGRTGVVTLADKYVDVTGDTMTGPLDLSKSELRNAVTHKLATPPAAPVEGQRYYDTVLKLERFWDGTAWVSGGGSGGSSVWVGPEAPPGTAVSGDQWYDTDDPNVLQLPVGIESGGTGATTAAFARTNLAVPGIPVLVTQGGTGATTAAVARTNLDVPGIPVPVNQGGTGATTAALARTALSVPEGVGVTKIEAITAAAYNALPVKNPTTYYVIT